MYKTLNVRDALNKKPNMHFIYFLLTKTDRTASYFIFNIIITVTAKACI